MSSGFSMKNRSSVKKQSCRASIQILNQSEQPYFCLIGQNFHKSELCAKSNMYTVNPYFDTKIEYMNFKINPDDISCIHIIYIESLTSRNRAQSTTGKRLENIINKKRFLYSTPYTFYIYTY